MLNKKIIKFGKSFKDVDKIKYNFFSDNNLLIKRQNKINKVYISQPKRKKCKACNSKLIGNFFINHNIKYIGLDNVRIACSFLWIIYTATSLMCSTM